LAKKYDVTIVAGSIFLPSPFVENGKIKTKAGDIYNVSAVFGNDGKIKEPLVLKNHPTEDEITFCVPGKESNYTYLLNQEKVGVLICADSWFQKNYDEFDKNQATVLVIPAYSAGEDLWETKWKGYSGYENPEDINRGDIDNITEGEAWKKYTLARSKNTSVQTAIAIFLRGKIWNLGTDGNSFIWRRDQIKSVPETDNPVIFKVEI
jgi:predicted amidohydrolase